MDREARWQPPPAATPTSAAVVVSSSSLPSWAVNEVGLEAPEPAPHNPHADHDALLSPMGTHHLTTTGGTVINGTHDAAHGDSTASLPIGAAAARARGGIMRTSPTPLPSILQTQRQADAAAYIASFRSRSRKVYNNSTAAMTAMAQGPHSPPSSLPSNPYLATAAAAAVADGTFATATVEECDNGADTALEYAVDLPPERDTGNIEYKWKLVAKSADRLVHLTTQMQYRLSEGSGECLYELGVQDDGYAQGLPPDDLQASVDCVLNMAASLRAEAKVITRARGLEGGLVAEVRVRRIADVDVSPLMQQQPPQHAQLALEHSMHSSGDAIGVSAAASAVGSPTFPRTPSSAQPLLSPTSLLGSSAAGATSLCDVGGDLRLALVGGSSSGKSSLLGCLVSNERDDGRGRARMHVVRHRHEVEKGRSSAISRQLLGFDQQGRVVYIYHTQTLGSSSVAASSSGAVASASPIAASAAASPSAALPVASPKATKAEKALTSLFGDDDDGDEDDEDDSDEDSTSDFGFEPVNADVSEPVETLPSLGVGAGGVVADSSAVLTDLSGGVGGDSSLSDDGCAGGPVACSSHDWQRILERSSKVYTLFDMPGHADSSRTTIYGLIGTSCPDYCCIVVSSHSNNNNINNAAVSPTLDAGVSTTVAPVAAASDALPASPPPLSSSSSSSAAPLISSLTREQILICAALHIPFLLLVCKADLASAEARAKLVRALHGVCADASVPPREKDLAGAPPGAVIVTHKIPLLLTPPPPPSAAAPSSSSSSEASSTATVAAELQAALDLISRNQLGGVSDADIPMLLRPMIMRTLTRTRSSGTTTAAASSASPTISSPRWYVAHTFTPLLLLSNLTGEGMDLFKKVLFRLRNYRRDEWDAHIRRPIEARTTAAAEEGDHTDTTVVVASPTAACSWEAVGVEFSVDDTFSVDGVGTVVSGTLLAGVIHEGQTLLLGPLPFRDGSVSGIAAAGMASSSLPAPAAGGVWPAHMERSSFQPVLVKSLHLSRKPFRNARAGQSATLALKRVDRALLRRGMVLLSVPNGWGPPASTSTVPRLLGAAAAVTPSPVGTPATAAWPRACVGFEAYIRLFDPHYRPSSGSSIGGGGGGTAGQGANGSTGHAQGRALRDAQHGGGSSSSGSGLNRRRLLGGFGGLSLRGQPIIHVGNVRQGGEVVFLRLVRLRSAASLARVESWMSHQEALVRSRDLDEPHAPSQRLANLLDELEAEERREEESKLAQTAVAIAASSQSVSPAATAAVLSPAPSIQSPPPQQQPAALYALVRFEFLYQSEYLRLGRSVLFRDERTRGTGVITDLSFVDDEEDEDGAGGEVEIDAGEGQSTEASDAVADSPTSASPKRRPSPPSPVTSSSSSSTPSPGPGVVAAATDGGGAARGARSKQQHRARLSSPPLPSKSTSPALSPSPSPSPSPFQRTRERRALVRKAEAAAAATLAATAVSTTDASTSTYAASAVAATVPASTLVRLRSQNGRPAVREQSQSQRGSLCAGAGVCNNSSSPLIKASNNSSVSLSCTPLLSASAWPPMSAPAGPLGAAAAAAAMAPLQLPSSVVPDSSA